MTVPDGLDARLTHARKFCSDRAIARDLDTLTKGMGERSAACLRTYADARRRAAGYRAHDDRANSHDRITAQDARRVEDARVIAGGLAPVTVSRSPKAARPETLGEARAWQAMKVQGVGGGLCEACSGQLAYARQFRDPGSVAPPCHTCASIVFSASQSIPWGIVPPSGKTAPQRDLTHDAAPMTAIPAPGVGVGAA